ncbi:hypothetical protein, partial [Escherichia coli]|uniref:hypothetical protein n=1 Tax=Escherichia coli TaxID=562 RepID=UPI0023059F7E
AILLVFMVLISAITASLKYHHIGLRNPATKIDYKVYSLFMLIGNALLSFSVISQYRSVINSGVTPTYETVTIYWIWMILFVVLSLISLYQL